VTRIQKRRPKQLLDDLKETREYWKLKQEALDRIVWRTGFGRGCGPVVRQITEWTDEWMNQSLNQNIFLNIEYFLPFKKPNGLLSCTRDTARPYPERVKSIPSSYILTFGTTLYITLPSSLMVLVVISLILGFWPTYPIHLTSLPRVLVFHQFALPYFIFLIALHES
jgi:hypothetical protein